MQSSVSPLFRGKGSTSNSDGQSESVSSGEEPPSLTLTFEKKGSLERESNPHQSNDQTCSLHHPFWSFSLFGVTEKVTYPSTHIAHRGGLLIGDLTPSLTLTLILYQVLVYLSSFFPNRLQCVCDHTTTDTQEKGIYDLMVGSY